MAASRVLFALRTTVVTKICMDASFHQMENVCSVSLLQGIDWCGLFRADTIKETITDIWDRCTFVVILFRIKTVMECKWLYSSTVHLSIYVTLYSNSSRLHVFNILATSYVADTFIYWGGGGVCFKPQSDLLATEHWSVWVKGACWRAPQWVVKRVGHPDLSCRSWVLNRWPLPSLTFGLPLPPVQCWLAMTCDQSEGDVGGTASDK